MKALTIHQPYAALIACKAKRIEWRTWAAPRNVIGERIAIHASVRVPPMRLLEQLRGDTAYLMAVLGMDAMACDPQRLAMAREVLRAMMDGWAQVNPAVADTMWPIPRGCVVATARVDAAIGARDILPNDPAASPGKWGWPLADIKPVAPCVPVRGLQRLWQLPPSIETQVLVGEEPDYDIKDWKNGGGC